MAKFILIADSAGKPTLVNMDLVRVVEPFTEANKTLMRFTDEAEMVVSAEFRELIELAGPRFCPPTGHRR